MFLFVARRFGRFGPLGFAYTGYQLWRRLSPQQKQALRAHAAAVVERARNRRRDSAAASSATDSSSPDGA